MMDWAYFEKLVSPAAELLNSLIPARDFASVPGSRAQEHELGRLCFRTCSCEAASQTGAAVASPVLLGVCSGLTQAPEIFSSPVVRQDGSEFPKELLVACRELAMAQLLPDAPLDAYRGPISLLKDAYRATQSSGSTTVLLAAIDNSSRIHGKIHPMVAVLSVGNCELLVLRRLSGPDGPLEVVFHPDPQEDTMGVRRQFGASNPSKAEETALEAIEEACVVQCLTAREGDIVVLGDERVFGSLFVHEVIELCNEMLPASSDAGCDRPLLLSELVHRIAQEASHDTDTPSMFRSTGADAHVVVGEVVKWDSGCESAAPSCANSSSGWKCGGAACTRNTFCDDESRRVSVEQTDGTGKLESCTSPDVRLMPPMTPSSSTLPEPPSEQIRCPTSVRLVSPGLKENALDVEFGHKSAFQVPTSSCKDVNVRSSTELADVHTRRVQVDAGDGSADGL